MLPQRLATQQARSRQPQQLPVFPLSPQWMLLLAALATRILLSSQISRQNGPHRSVTTPVNPHAVPISSCAWRHASNYELKLCAAPQLGLAGQVQCADAAVLPSGSLQVVAACLGLPELALLHVERDLAQPGFCGELPAASQLLN